MNLLNSLTEICLMEYALLEMKKNMRFSKITPDISTLTVESQHW